MLFDREPEAYAKTAWSDCQGAWQNLRESVVDHHRFPESQRLLFHIDEGMSWESVRDLNLMRRALTLVENIARQAKAPGPVLENIADVHHSFQELLEAIKDGKA
jgi:hypothetical protein